MDENPYLSPQVEGANSSPTDSVPGGAAIGPAQPDASSAEIETIPGPRLSALHVVLFAVCGGTCFLMYEFTDHGFEDWPTADYLTLSVASALATGATWAAMLAWPLWRKQGYRFPTHGGEWLLVVIALQTLLRDSANFLVALVEDPLPFAWLFRLMGGTGVLGSGILCYWLFCGWKTSQPMWTWFFCGVALNLTIMAYVVFVASPSTAVTVLPWLRVITLAGVLMLFAAAVSADLPARESLPWTHWLGVAVYLVNLGTQALEHFWSSQPS